MSGIELRAGALIVEREPSRLDELAIEFAEILGRFGVARLEEWATRLGVEDEYERRKRA